MSKIRIRGQVLYADLTPVVGATVKIIDLDEDGKNDTILTDTSDNQGRFSGLSKEYQDTRKLSVPPYSLPAFTDTMLLQFSIRRGAEQHSGPFLYVNETTSVPLVVPWPKPPATIARVNDVDCRNGEDIMREVNKALDNGTPVRIVVLDPKTNEALKVLAQSPDQILGWLDVKSPGTGTISKAFVADDIFVIFLAVAALILVVGVTMVLFALAFAIRSAIEKGYKHIKVKQKTTVAGQENETEVEISK